MKGYGVVQVQCWTEMIFLHLAEILKEDGLLKLPIIQCFHEWANFSALSWDEARGDPDTLDHVQLLLRETFVLLKGEQTS
jgi:hypothetical protein